MNKNKISTIIAILLLIALVIINYKMTRKAIDQCVQGGNDYYTCEKNLK